MQIIETDKPCTPGRLLKRLHRKSGYKGSLKEFAEAVIAGDVILGVDRQMRASQAVTDWWDSKSKSAVTGAHLKARLAKRGGRKIGARWVFTKKPSKNRRGLKGEKPN